MADKLYLSVRDLATRYSVSVRTVWRWAASGALPKPEALQGSVRRWLLADIERIEQAARGEAYTHADWCALRASDPAEGRNCDCIPTARKGHESGQ